MQNEVATSKRFGFICKESRKCEEGVLETLSNLVEIFNDLVISCYKDQLKKLQITGALIRIIYQPLRMMKAKELSLEISTNYPNEIPQHLLKAQVQKLNLIIYDDGKMKGITKQEVFEIMKIFPFL